MVFTEQHSVRCAQVAVYKFLGIPEDKLTKMHHYEKDPKVSRQGRSDDVPLRCAQRPCRFS